MEIKNENPQIIVGILLSCLGLFIGYGMPFFVGGMMTELGFSQTQANYVASAEFAGMTIASLLGIFWINHLNWRKVAIFALLAIAIGNLVSAYTPNFLALAIVRFLTALLGHGTAYALGAAVIGATSNPVRNFGLSGSVQYVMGSLTALLIPQAMATFGMAGYCIPAMILAIPALLVNTKLQTVKKSISGDEKSSSGLPFLFLPIACLLVFVIFQIGHGPRWDNFVPFGASVGLDARDVGIALSIAYGISFLGPLAAAALASKMSRNIPVLLALMVQFFVVISFQGQMEWIGFALRVIVFQMFWGFATTFIMGMIATADKTGRYIVLLPAAQAGGLSLGIAMSAFFVQGYGAGVISYICAGALIVTAVAFTLVSRKTDSI